MIHQDVIHKPKKMTWEYHLQRLTNAQTVDQSEAYLRELVAFEAEGGEGDGWSVIGEIIELILSLDPYDETAWYYPILVERNP